MRKTFKFICAAVVAAFAVSSCYDDSELWGELEGLEQRVAALEEKLNSEVATLNGLISTLDGKVKDLTAADENLLSKLTALNTQVEGAVKDAKAAKEAVNELTGKLDAADGKIDGVIDLEKAIKALDEADGVLDGKLEALTGDLKGISTELAAAVAKIAIVKVEKNTAGNYVLTFADGTTLEVTSAAASDNTGFVTVVDGKWAIVGADGKVKVLDANVHPDTELEFKVSDNYEVLVTYNGTDWEQTGVFVKDTQTINVVTGFKDGKDFVTITVGGVEYKLPKVSTNTFDIVSGMVFFAEGETKAIPVKMEGVVSAMVAKVPTGWTVDATSEGLTITAPASEDDEEDGEDDYLPDMGVGLSELSVDAEPADYGMVEVWVVTEDGKTFVGSVQVSLLGKFADITFSQDEEKGTMVKVTVPTEWDEWDEKYVPVYYPVFFGAAPVDEFDAASMVETLNYFYPGQDEATYPYIFGVYDLVDYGGGYMYPDWLSEKKVALSDMLEKEMEPGKTYVVWAFNRNANDYDNNEHAFIMNFYTPVEVDAKVTSTTWKDAVLDVTVNGADKFYLGAIPEYEYEQLSYYWSDEGIESIEMIGVSTNFYDMITGVSRLGREADAPGNFYEGSYKNKLSKIISEDEPLEVLPGDNFYLCILPIQSYKSPEDYSLSDLIFYKDVKINELLYGGTSTISSMEVSNVDYSSFAVSVKATDVDVVVYNFWTEEEYNSIVSDLDVSAGETIADYMIETFSYNFITTDSEFDAYCSEDLNSQSVTKGTSYTFAAFAIDNEGKCSEVKTVNVTTKDYPYDKDNSIKVAIDKVIFDQQNNSKVTVTYSLTGATNLAVYKSGGKMFVTSKSGESSLETSLATNINTYYRNLFTADSNGKVEVVYDNFNPAKYYNYKFTTFVAYNEESGVITEMSKAQTVDISTYLVSDLTSFTEAVANGGVVALGANITLTQPITIAADKEVTLNLRGNTLTFNNTGAAAGYAINNYGKLTVVNGSIIADGTQFAPGLYNEGEAVLNCNITSENSNAIKVDNGGKLTVEGGKYVSKNATGQALRVGNWQSGKASAWELTINGGEFVGPWAGLYIVNNYDGLSTAGKAVIKNATFEGSVSVVDSGVKGSDIVFDKVKNVTISNCTFKTTSIHSETAGESVINEVTITKTDDVYTELFGN